MSALTEKIVWPIVGVFIFGIIAGFYIDDRRRMLQENSSETSSNEQASQSASHNEHAGSTAESKHAKSEHAGKAAPSSSAKTTQKSNHAATSMSIDEYLSASANEISQKLEANVAHHQGFSGNIDEYLHVKPTKDMQTSSSGSTESHQTSETTSMSMEEYQAKSGGTSNKHVASDDAYHGGIDEYLAKYSDGNQTPVKNSSTGPFNKKGHVGFHGSYEEYAKKYN